MCIRDRHTTHGADKSKLKVSGEKHMEGLTFRGMSLTLSALVMDDLNCDILAGIPFCKANDVHVHLKSEQITIKDTTTRYGADMKRNNVTKKICRVDTCVLRSDKVLSGLTG